MAMMVDFNYEEYADEIGLSEAEQDNYYNMKEELQRQINAVVEENQLLRKGNEELMVALEQLRQKKNDILQMYRSTIRRTERLAAARDAQSENSYRERLEHPLRSRYTRYSHRYGISSGGAGTSSSAASSCSFARPSYSSYLSPALYSPSTCSSPNSWSPYSQEGMYLRAMEYARFSSSNAKYNRSGCGHGGGGGGSVGGQSCRFCYTYHH